MTIHDACLSIAGLRGDLASEALACLRAESVGSPAVGLRYHALVTAAMSTPDIWSAEERAAMLALVALGPGEPERRDQQINVRLTASERATLAAAATAAGETLTRYLVRAAMERAEG